MTIADSIPNFLPFLFKICIESKPAKKKSPNPKIVQNVPCSVTTNGMMGNTIATGSLSPIPTSAYSTIDFVTKTKIMSAIVTRMVKIHVVFHVNKVPMYRMIRTAKIAA